MIDLRARFSLDDVAQIEDGKIWQRQFHYLNHLRQEQIPTKHIARKEAGTGCHDTPGCVRVLCSCVIYAGCSKAECSRSADEEHHEYQIGAERAQQEDD